jgi:outer membrane protein assembly factor BamE
VVQVVKNEKLFGFVPIYPPDVQQGNFITQEMVAQLKNGMTKDQVRFLLGTPLLIDNFHQNRWDYPFRLKNGDGQLTASRVVVFFENDKVAKFEGGDLPTEKDYLMRIAAPKKK